MLLSSERPVALEQALISQAEELSDQTLTLTERLLVLQKIIGLANEGIATTIAQMLVEETQHREQEVEIPFLSFEAILNAIEEDTEIPVKSRTKVINCLSSNRKVISSGSTKENRVFDPRFVRCCLDSHSYDQFRQSRYGRELNLRNMGVTTFGYLVKHLRLHLENSTADSTSVE